MEKSILIELLGIDFSIYLGMTITYYNYFPQFTKPCLSPDAQNHFETLPRWEEDRINTGRNVWD